MKPARRFSHRSVNRPRLAGSAAVLTLVYALMLDSFAPLDLAFGALASAVLLFSLRAPLRLSARPGGQGEGEEGLPRRLAALPALLGAEAAQVIAGAWGVGRASMTRRLGEHAGLVEVPIGARSPAAVAVQGLLAGLSPGEMLVDVDWERRLMLFHVMDARDPEALREGYEDFYRRRLRPVIR